MNTSVNTAAATSQAVEHAETPLVISAVSALEKDVRWMNASEEERRVLKRIAQQRDRLCAAKQAHLQAKGLDAKLPESVPADAPFPERMAAFVRLHPVATAAAAGVALMVGPRRLIRYGSWVLPWVSRFRR